MRFFKWRIKVKTAKDDIEDCRGLVFLFDPRDSKFLVLIWKWCCEVSING